MALPINSQFYFDPFNHGWVYVLGMDDGTLVVRSVLGEYSVIDAPVDSATVINDYISYLKSNALVPLSQIDTDDKGGTKDATA